MANKTLPMHKIKQILLFLDRGVSQRNIALQMGVNRRSVANYCNLAKQTNMPLSELVALSDHELAKCLGMLDNDEITLDDERKEHLESLYLIHNFLSSSKYVAQRKKYWRRTGYLAHIFKGNQT
ncbi:hypothetical protein HX017_16925 [Myroides marinus]|uniref:hypothetical protein n=2 Tax=Myroides marinus TaxID=703342 RepID=UPI0025791AEE|nr:hypothetical protein [Myroides marinus]MDM1348962.1 hypothetical protein [Myroides marinus]MDM1352301.1 hypothetical protein [Myroides marinus]MDM1356092.1 hypothetical protein [Myroides marinus]MDM1359497.1 hypothetical protein [Myroides marinus]MDM1366617.1 hypothetical protein [Myroides marinus]